MTDADRARYEREREYHDERFEHEKRDAAAKYYSTGVAAQQTYRAWLLEPPLPSNVLELGCGPAAGAFELARRGVSVLGIDISTVAVEQARAQAAEEGLESAKFEIMNAERLGIESSSIDLVFGSGVLHHLDLDNALPEVLRVLASDGRGLFIEPLGHHPLINLYRRLTPSMRSPDEHPLKHSDIELFKRQGADVQLSFFGLTTLLATPFRRMRWFETALRFLEMVDRMLFSLVPPLRWLAWTVIIEFHPRVGSVR